MNEFRQIISDLQDKTGGVLGLTGQTVEQLLPPQCTYLDHIDIKGANAKSPFDFLVLGEAAFLLDSADHLNKLVGEILYDHGLLLLFVEIDSDLHLHTVNVSRLIQTISSWNHFEFITKFRQNPFDIYLIRHIKKIPSTPMAPQTIGMIIDQKLNTLFTNHPLVYNALRKIYLSLQRFFPPTHSS